MTTRGAKQSRPDPAARPSARATWWFDVATLATRALVALPRELSLLPVLTIPSLFFFLNVGALEGFIEARALRDFPAFYLPVAILFSITGLSRAGVLVADIRSGYFDRLLASPIHRAAILPGVLVADAAVFVIATIPVVGLAHLAGVGFSSGAMGIGVFVALVAAWGVAAAGFPYAIALWTGSPAALGRSFVFWFPISFLTTSYLPESELAPWLASAARWNPLTYLLEGLRSLISVGWEPMVLGRSVLAVLVVVVIAQGPAHLALARRIRRDAR